MILLLLRWYFSVPYYEKTKATISVYSSHMRLVAHIKIHPQKAPEALWTFLTDCLLWAWFQGKETLGKIKLRNTGMSKESGCFEKCKNVTSVCWGVLNKLECAGLCPVSLISTPDCQGLCLFHWIKSMGQHCILTVNCSWEHHNTITLFYFWFFDSDCTASYFSQRAE